MFVLPPLLPPSRVGWMQLRVVGDYGLEVIVDLNEVTFCDGVSSGRALG